ncbi:MAG: DUF1476 domain-containing protein [Alphaproteobacteria bacterium]
MTMFDERESGFEAKFAHDEELKFKVDARRCKLLGLWAAGVMGLIDAEAETYARELLGTDLQEHGSADILGKLTSDLTAKGIDPQQVRLHEKMVEFHEIAKKQIMTG